MKTLLCSFLHAPQAQVAAQVRAHFASAELQVMIAAGEWLQEITALWIMLTYLDLYVGVTAVAAFRIQFQVSFSFFKLC